MLLFLKLFFILGLNFFKLVSIYFYFSLSFILYHLCSGDNLQHLMSSLESHNTTYQLVSICH